MSLNIMDTIITLANLLCGRRNEYVRATNLLKHADEALQREFSGLITACEEINRIQPDTSLLLAEYGKANSRAIQHYREAQNTIHQDFQQWTSSLSEIARLSNPLSPLAPVLQATWPPKQGSFGIYECLGECFSDIKSARVHFDSRREAVSGDARTLINQAVYAMGKAVPASVQMWHCVLSDRIDTEGFKMAREIYDYYFYIPGDEHALRASGSANYPAIDSLLAQAMVYSRVSPDMLSSLSQVVGPLAEMMCANKNGLCCRTLASGFSWIGEAAGILEIIVLQKMLDAGLPEMDTALQERLILLGEKESGTPDIKQIAPQANVFAVDFDALSWNESQYGAFFKKLIQANQPLQYALAVSQWKKEFSPQTQWDFYSHAQKLCESTEEEYDGLLTAQSVTVRVLLEGGVPIDQEGVLFLPSRNRSNLNYFAMLFQASKLRRNVSLRLYTLYMPPSEQTNEQMRNMKSIALSIKQNTNPEVADLINDIQNYVAETGEYYANPSDDSGLY